MYYIMFIVFVCSAGEVMDISVSLQPPVAEEEAGEGGEGQEEEAFEIPKTPEPKEWVCLGSDLEVLEMHVHTYRPLVSEREGMRGERRRGKTVPCFWDSCSQSE